MTSAPAFTDWKDPPFPAKSICPLRLAAVDGGLAIYQAAVTDAPATIQASTGRAFQAALTPVTVSGKPPLNVTFSVSHPIIPNFDIVALGNGNYAVAAELFGGGGNALVLCEATPSALNVSACYQDFTDYRLPRFVRGLATPGRFTTAVVDGPAVAIVTGKPLAADELGKKPSPVTRLIAGDAGVAIATQPPNGALAAVALFSKNGSGTPLKNGDLPGTLTVAAVTSSGIKQAPTPLLDSGGTYSFDCDAHANTALVLASTGKGPRLLAVDLGTGDTADVAWPQGYPATGTWIASPTVLAVPGGSAFALAFFEIAANGTMGVRFAQLDFSNRS